MPLRKVVVHVKKRLDCGDAGVVHQHVDVTEGFHDRAHRLPHRGAIGDVAFHEQMITAQFPELLGRRLAPLDVYIQDGDPGPALRERLRHTPADAAAAARDDHLLPGHVHDVPEVGH